MRAGAAYSMTAAASTPRFTGSTARPHAENVSKLVTRSCQLVVDLGRGGAHGAMLRDPCHSTVRALSFLRTLLQAPAGANVHERPRPVAPGPRPSRQRRSVERVASLC